MKKGCEEKERMGEEERMAGGGKGVKRRKDGH
jgi:hypothetical protein